MTDCTAADLEKAESLLPCTCQLHIRAGDVEVGYGGHVAGCVKIEHAGDVATALAEEREACAAALKDTIARAERAETELESLATPAGWSNIQSRPAALFVQDRIDKVEAERDKWRELACKAAPRIAAFAELEWAGRWLAKLRELEDGK